MVIDRLAFLSALKGQAPQGIYKELRPGPQSAAMFLSIYLLPYTSGKSYRAWLVWPACLAPAVFDRLALLVALKGQAPQGIYKEPRPGPRSAPFFYLLFFLPKVILTNSFYHDYN